MNIKKNVEKFAEDEGIELKSWQRDNLRKIERRISSETSEDEIMGMVHDELKKTGFFLKDESYRKLKRKLF